MMTVRSIVGRETELQVLHSFLCDRSGPTLALLLGEAGIGKTSLLTSVAADARQTVLWARPIQAEAASSYGALDDLFRSALGLLPRLADPERRALEVALSPTPRLRLNLGSSRTHVVRCSMRWATRS